jgi:sugar phosphate isomerase/epimerase
VGALRRLGYRAAYCPVDARSSAETIRGYAAAAAQADVVIAEVGAWSNPLSPDAETRRAALSRSQEQLALAEAIGARCCVNISGSRGERWDGPHPANLTPETFALIVETVRAIIDAVKPTRTFYTLEPMPWMYPDSADSYLELIRAIDRPRFAVHLDVVNMIASPRLFYGHAALIRECVTTLGPYIKSCHIKDITMADRLTLHLDEVRPGLGSLDFRVQLRELARLDADMPVMLEHMETPDEYELAADYVRAVARDQAVSLL